METTKQKKIVIGAAAAVVVIVIVAVISVFLMNGPQKNAPSVAGNNPQTTNTTTAPRAVPTRLPTPTNVIVPEAGAMNVPANIAVPQVEAAASPSGNSKYRSFNIIIQAGQFIPNTVTVNLGDIVNLEVGAVGAGYDFTQPDYDIKASIPDNGSKRIQFGAAATGKFVFYCSSCGGPAKGPLGYLIVVGT